MLTRFSDFLHRHEPVTKLLMRLALLAIFASIALDFHYISLDADDIADRMDQMQADLSSLRNSIDGGGDMPDETAIFDRTRI